MQRKHLKKIKVGEFPENGGWFYHLEDKEIYVYCPPVNGYGKLTNHTIDNNGEVNASVLIKGTDGNGNKAEYHEYVILDDWPTNWSKRTRIGFVDIEKKKIK